MAANEANFWRNISVEEQEAEQGVEPISDIRELAAPDEFDDQEVHAFLGTLRQ